MGSIYTLSVHLGVVSCVVSCYAVPCRRGCVLLRGEGRAGLVGWFLRGVCWRNCAMERRRCLARDRVGCSVPRRQCRAGQNHIPHACCMTVWVPPICRLTCSRAQRAVSMVRDWNSLFARVSLIIAVTHSWRKPSTSSPLGYASARSLWRVSYQTSSSQEPVYIPDDTHCGPHQRLAPVSIVGNAVKHLKDGRYEGLEDLGCNTHVSDQHHRSC